MAGRRHHYLPQLIQRPFAFRQSGKEYYVRAYHRTRGRFTPNTAGLGKELDFYGGPEDTSLDDAMTSGEGELAKVVQALNRGEHPSPVEMATLVCALAFRTKAMRDALAGMMPAIVSALRIKVLDISRIRRDLLASLNDPKERKRQIFQAIDSGPPQSREQRAKAYAALLPAWRKYVSAREDELVGQAWATASLVMDKIRSEATNIAQASYLEVLSRDPTVPARARKLMEEMVFTVIQAPEGQSFILGDCGPVARFSDGKSRLVLGAVNQDADIEHIFLPISPSRCIHAHAPSSTWWPSVAEINKISASLSVEFFISDCESGEDLEALRESIGTLDPVDSEEDIIQELLDQAE